MAEQHKCNVCKKTFGSKRGLIHHERVHSISEIVNYENLINCVLPPNPSPIPAVDPPTLAVDVVRTRSQATAAALYDPNQSESESESDSDNESFLPCDFDDADSWCPVTEEDIECSAVAVALSSLNVDIDADLGVSYNRTIEEQAREHSVYKYDLTMAKLYQTCDDAGAPKYLCDKIIGILRQEMNNGFDIHSGIVTQRRAYFNRVCKGLSVKPPEEVVVALNSGKNASVFRLDFKEQLQRHLVSLPFADMDNIDLPDLENCWQSSIAPGIPPGHTTVIDSSWYCDTVATYASLLATGQYLLHPLILYVDKTGTDKIMKASVEPLVCISAHLNQQTRQNTLNWFIIGYLPNLELSSRAGRRLTTQNSSADYHRCLRVLLEPLKQMQHDMPVMTFRRGRCLCPFRIICPIATIVGDNLSQDRLCGKILNRGPTSVRMSRSCLTPFCDSDAVPHVCHRMPTWLWHKLNMVGLGACHSIPDAMDDPPLPRLEIVDACSPNFSSWKTFLGNWQSCSGGLNPQDLIALRKLREVIAQEILGACLGSHCLVNAFEGMDFGADSCIHTSTMADIMHSVEEGLFPYITGILLDPLSDSEKRDLDALVELMFSTNGRNRSGERNEYPRVSFKKGFCSLTMISADEHVGQLFVISILLHTELGRKALMPRFALNFDALRAERVAKAAEAAAARAAKKKKNASKKKKGSAKEPSHRQHSEDENDPVNNVETVQLEQEEEEAPAKRQRNTYSQAQIRQLLQKLDLKFLWDCRDRFPSTTTAAHRKKMFSILEDKLKPSTRLEKLLKHTGPLFSNSLLDYQPSGDSIPVSKPAWPSVVAQARPPNTAATPRIVQGREECTIKLTMEQFTKWLESLLAFHAFLKYGYSMFKEAGNISAYQKAYCALIATLISSFKRGAGTNEFKLQKLVECAHFIKDHLWHGPPAANNTDTGERGLKTWAKAPAKTAQNRDDPEFKKQVAQNVIQAYTLRLIRSTELVESNDCLEDEASATQPLKYSPRGKSLKYIRSVEKVGVFPCRTGRDAPRYHHKFPTPILEWFNRAFSGGFGEIQLINEVTLGLGSPTPELIRAHPDFNGDGPWYDFVDVDYNELGVFPSRCACFFEWPEWGDPFRAGIDWVPEKNSIMVLIHECNNISQANLVKESLLYSHYTLRGTIDSSRNQKLPILKCVSVESINGRIYCIDPTPDKGGIFFREKDRNNKYGEFDIIKVKDRKTHWPQSFLSPRPGR